MMHPYLFEDPFITTGVSAWGIYHEFPARHRCSTAATSGTSRCRRASRSPIASRSSRPRTAASTSDRATAPLDKDYGFTDITIGLKGSLIDKPDVPFILTPSLRYQIAVGGQGVLQGNGSGVFIPDISTAWGYEKFHVIGDFGGQFPVDTDAQSTSLFYHLHLDYALFRYLVPFFEVGGFHYLDGGDGSTQGEPRSRGEHPDRRRRRAASRAMTTRTSGCAAWRTRTCSRTRSASAYR